MALPPIMPILVRWKTRGIELSVQASLVCTRNLEWIVGGNIARAMNKIKSLGGEDQIVLDYNNGVQMVHRVGESPYQYYGYKADGVFSTQAEADAANLSNRTGMRYSAGDVRFVDQNGDNRIDDKDRVLLGNASPRYFGGFYTQLKYKGICAFCGIQLFKRQYGLQCCKTTIGIGIYDQ